MFRPRLTVHLRRCWLAVTTIIKGTRVPPYKDSQVVEKQERKYGDFTMTFNIPHDYEVGGPMCACAVLGSMLWCRCVQRKWDSCHVENGVLCIKFKRDSDDGDATLPEVRACTTTCSCATTTCTCLACIEWPACPTPSLHAHARGRLAALGFAAVLCIDIGILALVCRVSGWSQAEQPQQQQQSQSVFGHS